MRYDTGFREGFQTENRIDWRTLFPVFTFLLAVFYFATPINFKWSTELYAIAFSDEGGSGFDLVNAVLEGDTGRRLGLLALALFGADSLVRKRGLSVAMDSPLGHLVLFFLFWSTISVAWTDEFGLTARKVVILWFLCIGAVALAARFDLQHIIHLTLLMTAVTLLASISAEAYLGTLKPFAMKYRFSGVIHPVEQGWNCGLLVLSSVYLVSTQKRFRFVYILLAVLGCFFLALTKSRMPFASTMVSVALFLGIRSASKWHIATVFTLIVLCCIAYFITGEKFIGYSKTLIHLGRGQEAAAGLYSFTGRLDLWKHLFALSANRPILGYGYNTFLTPDIIQNLSLSMEWVPASSHSGYVQMLLGLGFAGLSLFVALLTVALRKAFSLAKTLPSYSFAAVTLVWLCINLFLESQIFTAPIFPAFLCYVLLAHLSFFAVKKGVPEEP